MNTWHRGGYAIYTSILVLGQTGGCSSLDSTSPIHEGLLVGEVQLPVGVLLPAALETDHFRITTGGTRVVNSSLQNSFDEVYEYVRDRMGIADDEEIILSFQERSAEPCAARGVTMPHPAAEIILLVDEGTNRSELLAVLAHEVGHILHHRRFEPEPITPDSDLGIVSEGLATWAAGEYWTSPKSLSSFQSAVRDYLYEGLFLPLDWPTDPRATSLLSANRDECLRQRDIVYTERAAFVEYLIEQHGQEKLSALLDGSRDFFDVFGESLDALESRWLRGLANGNGSESVSPQWKH